MAESKHTPGPLSVINKVGPRRPIAVATTNDAPKQGVVALMDMKSVRIDRAEQIANAEHIVRCVNAHDDMLAALERIASDQTVFELDGADEGWDVESLASWHESNVNAARAAIAKAKGE